MYKQCNEQGPPCSQCSKRQIACVYPQPDRLDASEPHTAEDTSTSHSREASITPSDDPMSRRTLELELMHQWSTNTYRSFLGESTPDYPLWQLTLPREALKHEFLLQGFFSMTALEIAITTECSDYSKYANAALEYYDKASSTFRQEITNITQEKQEVLYAFSCLAMVLCLALPRFTKAYGERTKMIDSILVYHEFTKGAALILEQFGGQLRQTRILSHHKLFDDVPKKPLDAKTEEAISRLHFLNDQRHELAVEPSDLLGSPSLSPQDACKKAIVRLEESFARCQEPLLWGYSLAWLKLAGAEFVEWIKREDSVALLALMHWGVLLKRCSPGIWWAETVGPDIVDEIAKHLAPEEDPTLAASISWTRAEVGI